MLVIIFLLLLGSIGFFVYSFFSKDYAKELQRQVDDVYISLMKEVKNIKKRTDAIDGGGKNV
ncbi:hypothetical protein [Pseudalkalibacillus caeni]|uniref:Uncharacterized protein n=1 Tax=Exobacillus caeni TaxID=2574798 RepID=A0A5R9FBA7_9BACL|nr:hypothetical protein [Pseudalkalibacillus caeni]TLS38173.1 hypothetical protein FCL54_06440 [Pseudalkalibacillus caeni]